MAEQESLAAFLAPIRAAGEEAERLDDQAADLDAEAWRADETGDPFRGIEIRERAETLRRQAAALRVEPV